MNFAKEILKKIKSRLNAAKNKDNKTRWYFSLRASLLVSYVVISFLPLMFNTLTVYTALEKQSINERMGEISRQANVMARTVEVGNFIFDSTKTVIFNNAVEEISKDISGRILVMDKNGIVINDSQKTEIGKTYLIPEVMEALDGKDVKKFSNRIIYTAVSILGTTETNSSEIIGAVLIISSTEDIYEHLSDIQSQLFLLAILTSFIVGVFVFFISGIVIEPIKNILNVIKKMSDGHLNERIEEKGHNELYQLAVSFNNMAEKLEKVEITRQEFVSNVSHELKTPLSSIKVLSESLLLQEGIPEEMYREFLQDINFEVDRMTDIINDLLQLVKLDMKQTAIVFKPVNLNKCVEDIIKRLQPLADKKHIKLNYEKLKEVTTDADEMKLSLALSNLIDNAIKYTDDNGNVDVEVDSDHQNAFVKVKDTGIGISEEEQQKVFERFYRVDKTRSRETGGTGLGLAITHNTVLMHNGSIKLISKDGEGSTFIVRIPLKQS